MADEPEKPRKRGQRPRGDRSPITMRVPIEQRAVYEARAAELGIPLSSWVAIKLAEAEGLPVPDYVLGELKKAALRRDSEKRQEGRPLARTA